MTKNYIMNWKVIIIGIILILFTGWIANRYFGVDYKLIIVIGITAMLISVVYEKFFLPKAKEIEV